MFDFWERKPATLLRGDSHLGNTFGASGHGAGFFDRQVIFRGYGLRDLSYFLLSALTNEQRLRHERETFDLYVDPLAGLDIVPERRSAWRDFCPLRSTPGTRTSSPSSAPTGTISMPCGATAGISAVRCWITTSPGCWTA